MALCERCVDHFDRERPGSIRENGETLCDDCCDAAAERAHESFLERYYGGGSPVTVQEQHDAAAKQRRELRRHD